MADPYLAISEIAHDQFMRERMTAAATQQEYLGNIDFTGGTAQDWVQEYRYVWASSPSWGEKWRYAETVNPDGEHGKDPAVITDGDVLATVQHLGDAPARYQAEHEQPEDQREQNTADAVDQENQAVA